MLHVRLALIVVLALPASQPQELHVGQAVTGAPTLDCSDWFFLVCAYLVCAC